MSSLTEFAFLSGGEATRPRVWSQRGLIEPWVPVTLSLAAIWAAAAVRYHQWLRHGGEKAEAWRASYGKYQPFHSVLKAWLLENGILAAMAMLCKMVFPPRDKKTFMNMLGLQLLRSVVITEGSWLVLNVCIKHIYACIPYFSSVEAMPRPSWSEFFQAWVRLMIPLRVLGAANEANELISLTDAKYHTVSRRTKSAGVLGFLLQFAVVRSLHDIGFYVGHWVIHQPLFYGWIHKRHHEHKEPSVLTNNHFWMLDLFIESGVSLIAAMMGVGLFRRAGFQLNNFELSYIVCALLWYENGSHSGKQLPCVTVFPPLSFISWIDWTLGGGVAHHHQHHRQLQSNYSIAAWPDRALGTWRPLTNNYNKETKSIKQDRDVSSELP